MSKPKKKDCVLFVAMVIYTIAIIGMLVHDLVSGHWKFVLADLFTIACCIAVLISEYNLIKDN
jgi:hypothetical protein